MAVHQVCRLKEKRCAEGVGMPVERHRYLREEADDDERRIGLHSAVSSSVCNAILTRQILFPYIPG